jgi:dTDP-L-rhamnose 4-epimerase
LGKNVLIVGGAGFIGSHLADELLAHDHYVRALDNLDPQVHGPNASRPSYLNSDVELIVGDVRDCMLAERALQGIDVVYHLAAAVGVGQSMYEIARYSSINSVGTAVLLEEIIRHPVERLIVASSMSIYGEGSYKTPLGQLVTDARRDLSRLARHEWELTENSSRPLTPIPTIESKAPDPSSVYALLKYHQERTCLCVGEAYQIPTVALRFFNVFGSRQALSNPYTGVMAIFAARLLNGEPPLIYEDGLQQRDFVSVHDVSRACYLAMQSPAVVGQVLNVGSGRSCTIHELAERMADVLGLAHIQPQTTGKYRVGDVRHCFADISLAQDILRYEPQVSLERGLIELAQWIGGQVAFDRVAEAGAELTQRGLQL